MSDWGPWTEHDGSGVPNEVIGRFIGIRSLFSCGERGEEGFVSAELAASEVSALAWSGGGLLSDRSYIVAPIIRYRIRKPKGLTILEEVAKNIKVTERA